MQVPLKYRMFQPKSTTIAIYTLVACLVLTLLQLAVAIRSEGGTCKCVPNIWNGMLLSIENEFDLQTKRTTTSQNKMLMSYDSINRKISMQTMDTASLTIADYKNVSTVYIVHVNINMTCTKIDIIHIRMHIQLFRAQDLRIQANIQARSV